MTAFCIPRHAVASDPDTGLSRLQGLIASNLSPVRIFSAPTGAGKSFTFEQMMRNDGKRILFIVPTRRLAQNLAVSLKRGLVADGIPPATIATMVHLWTSDEARRKQAIDTGFDKRLDRLETMRSPGPKMIFATPESVAWYLLNPALRAGKDPESILDLLRLDHVVFDEFHTIDARGMGISCALAAISSRAQGGCQVTFLSATPIDITAPLKAMGIEEAMITRAEEDVSTGPTSETPGMRAIHGDVSVEITEEDVPTLLTERLDLVRETLARTDGSTQVVLVFDSLKALLKSKGSLFDTLASLGLGSKDILSINSTDDSVSGEMTGLCTIGQENDPLDFKVLIATSSVEMGVTFKAGLILMDPGHDACSFVQRLGRVARGDVSGHVLVAVPDARRARSPWLRSILMSLEDETAKRGGIISIDRFQEIVLATTRAGFDGQGKDLCDDKQRSFSRMPQRATWCAGLFWAALEQAAHYKGMRDTLRAFRPKPAAVVGGILRGMMASENDYAKAWANAFLAEARVLRLIEQKVVLLAPDGRTRALSWTLWQATPALRSAPCRVSEKGVIEVLLDRDIDGVLENLGKDRVERTAQAILPHRGIEIRIREAEARADFLRALQGEVLSPMTDEDDMEIIENCRKLVTLTGIVPVRRDADMSAGDVGIV